MSFKQRNNAIPLTSREKDIKEELFEILIYLRKNMLNNILFTKQKIPNQIIENNNKNIKVIINFIKDLIKILFSSLDSFLEKNSINIGKENNDKIHELNNNIIKLENDIKFYIRKVFQYKIQRDALQYNVKKFKEMKEEFDLLKEKVKYKDGKFLKDDRKDNEIFILRKENSNLKNEIEKMELKCKNYEETILKKEKIIDNLNIKIKRLNNKIVKNENKLYINTIYNTERSKKTKFIHYENKYNALTNNNINIREFNSPYRNLSYNNINNNNININHSTTNNNHIINNNIIINSYNKKDIKLPNSKNKTKNKNNSTKRKNINNSVFSLLRKSINKNKNYNNFLIKNNENFINVKLNKSKFKRNKKVNISMKVLQLSDKSSQIYFHEKSINQSVKK